MTEGYNDRLRAYIEAAILDQAPTWESLFDSGPGQVVGVRDAAVVAAMAASRFRLLYDADPSRCPDCGNPGDVCFCKEQPRRRCTCPVGNDAIGPHTRGCPNHPEFDR